MVLEVRVLSTSCSCECPTSQMPAYKDTWSKRLVRAGERERERERETETHTHQYLHDTPNPRGIDYVSHVPSMSPLRLEEN